MSADTEPGKVRDDASRNQCKVEGVLDDDRLSQGTRREPEGEQPSVDDRESVNHEHRSSEDSGSGPATPSLLSISPSSNVVSDYPNIISAWLLEIGVLFLAICSLGAIVAVVLPYQGKAIPDWPSAISINAVISVLSVVLRATLVVVAAGILGQYKWTWFLRPRQLIDMDTLDNATRGPWGCILLLFHLSKWSFRAAVGAIIITLTVAIGPFTQQLVRYYSCQLPSTAINATIPRLGLFYMDIAYDSMIPVAVQQSIYGAMFAPQSISISAACASGNCSFPEPYHTLAFCSECTDVSEQVEIITNASYYDEAGWLSSNYDFNLPAKTSARQRNLTIPRSLPLGVDTWVATAEQLQFDEASLLGFMVLTDPYGTAFNSRNCSDAEANSTSSSWYCRGYGAAQCKLSPCIESYRAAVTGGVLKETLINQVVGSDWGGADSYTTSLLYLPCLTSDHRQSLTNAGYHLTPQTDWLPYNRSLDRSTGEWINNSGMPISSNDDLDTLPPTCLYQMDDFALLAIAAWLWSIVPGNITMTWPMLSGPPVVQQLYDGSNSSLEKVEAVLDNVARGLSAHMRQSGINTTGVPANISRAINVPNQPATGVTLESKTCIDIRWAWLAFPATITAVTAVFFVLAILTMWRDMSMHARRGSDGGTVLGGSRPPVWRSPGVSKSSILPLVFHGLEDDMVRSKRSGRLLPVEVMEQAAKTTIVKMGHTDDSWKFITSTDVGRVG